MLLEIIAEQLGLENGQYRRHGKRKTPVSKGYPTARDAVGRAGCHHEASDHGLAGRLLVPTTDATSATPVAVVVQLRPADA